MPAQSLGLPVAGRKLSGNHSICHWRQVNWILKRMTKCCNYTYGVGIDCTSCGAVMGSLRWISHSAAYQQWHSSWQVRLGRNVPGHLTSQSGAAASASWGYCRQSCVTEEVGRNVCLPSATSAQRSGGEHQGKISPMLILCFWYLLVSKGHWSTCPNQKKKSDHLYRQAAVFPLESLGTGMGRPWEPQSLWDNQTSSLLPQKDNCELSRANFSSPAHFVAKSQHTAG